MIVDIQIGNEKYYGVHLVGDSYQIRIQSISGKCLGALGSYSVVYEPHRILFRGVCNLNGSGTLPKYEDKTWVVTRTVK